MISKVLRGYDSIFTAGTGYGKSLVFQGLAVLGVSKKAVIIVSPLKALEADTQYVVQLVFSLSDHVYVALPSG